MLALRSFVLGAAVTLVSGVALAAPTAATKATPAPAPAPVPVPVPVKDGPGTTVVRAANDTISSLLKLKVAAGSAEEAKLAASVTAKVRDFLDIDQLGELALGEHLAKMSEAQRKDFRALLRALIEDNYVKGLRANLSYTVSYLGEQAGKDGAIEVQTAIDTKRNGRPYQIKIDYVLRTQDGKLRAFDVKTDHVGLVENYKITFDKIIAKDGVDGLIAKMQKKRAAGLTAPAKP
jgi:ABC-type transporter MlaC component